VRVRDERGRARRGVTVLLVEDSGYMRTGETEADGEVVFTDVPPGVANVSASDAGAGRLVGRHLDLLAGEERFVELDPLAASAWATRLLVDGRPCADALAFLSSATGAWRTASARTDSEGRVTLEGVGEGAAVLTCALAPGAEPLRLELPRFGDAPPPEELELGVP
jgi:hypothetical protein